MISAIREASLLVADLIYSIFYLLVFKNLFSTSLHSSFRQILPNDACGGICNILHQACLFSAQSKVWSSDIAFLLSVSNHHSAVYRKYLTRYVLCFFRCQKCCSIRYMTWFPENTEGNILTYKLKILI